ncbi:TPA: glycosyltransferase [Vibrio vulnificus]|nr:glycosyltransferase [Vibrio vulnificus]
MNVLYLTWGETPRSYGVFHSQVMSQFIETYEQFPEANFSFASAVPIIHSGLVRERFGYKNELATVKQQFAQKGIQFDWIPMLIPQNMIFGSGALFHFVQKVTQFFINKRIKLNSLDIVHCRSYFSAYAANKLREKHGYKYKVIFDARGFLPEEIAMKHRLAESSNEFKFFKEIEAYLLSVSDSTVTVSDTMYSTFMSLNPKRLDNIYLSTDFRKLTPVKKNVRNITKETAITLLYLGALGEELWHQPTELAKVFRKVKSIYTNAKLKIITTNNHTVLKQYFSEFSEDEVVFTSTKNQDELALEIKNIDLAVLPYRRNRDFAEARVGHSILGTKTVEYLASGVPVLCNRDCGGAAAVIGRHSKFGLVYSPGALNELSYISLSDLVTGEFDKEDFLLLSEIFDYKKNSEKYAALYKDLINS